MCEDFYSIDFMLQGLFPTKFSRQRNVSNSQSKNSILHGRWNNSSELKKNKYIHICNQHYEKKII